jgi:hypothetical protein
MRSWEDLLEFVRSNIHSLPELEDNFYPERMNTDREDFLSDQCIPLETYLRGERSEYWFCIDTSKDGNCLPHVLSRYVFGHEGRPHEMRVRMCFEGVYHFRDYVDSNLLMHGGEGAADLARIYAMRSGQNTIGFDLNNPDHLLMIYQLEIMECTKKGMYSGLWALHVAANVLSRPVISWYPHVADSALQHIREFLQRTIEPFDPSYTNRRGAIIMWTKTSPGSVQYDHFVSVCR